MRVPSRRLVWRRRLRSTISNHFPTKVTCLDTEGCRWPLDIRMARALNATAPMCFSFRLAFTSLLLVFALHSNGSPTISRNQNSLVTFNSSFNEIIPHCYTPEGGDTPDIKPVDLKSCKDALAVLVQTPDFTTRFRFSKNPRAMAKELPVGWQLGIGAPCRIVVSCQNNKDSAVFRYADIAQVARNIIDNCVDKPDPHGRYPVLKWGGIRGILGEATFYVAVARPLRSVLALAGTNLTKVTSGGLLEESTAAS